MVTECREIIEPAGASRWSERQTASHAKLEENRESVTEAMPKEQFLSESLCCYCKQASPISVVAIAELLDLCVGLVTYNCTEGSHSMTE